MAKFGIGQPVRRSEDPRLLTGRGRYTDDIHQERGAVGVFLRSPVAHARITELSVDAARALPGVIGIVTGADLTAAGIKALKCHAPVKNRDGETMFLPERPALATDIIRFAGEAIALVVAETLEAGRDAAEAIEFEFEELDPAVDMMAAIADGASQIWDGAPGNVAFDWELGDQTATDTVFEQAAKVVSLDLVNNRVVASPMEGRACQAAYNPQADQYTVYVSSQGVHGLQRTLSSENFEVDKSKFRVVTTDVGGGFGMKIFNYPEYVAVIAAAKITGRPVRWAAERTEGFLSDDHGRDHVTHAELALDADNRMLALRVETHANLGAYLSNFAPFVATAGNRMLPGLYTLQQTYCRVKGVYTNTQPIDAYRGAGRPEAAYVIERIVDLAAIELGETPDGFRRKNLIPTSALPYTTTTGLEYDSGEFEHQMTEAMERADWAGFPARKSDSAKRGLLRGIGMATYVEICSGGGPEHARVQVGQDGRLMVHIGSQTNGQGHETAYKQVIAEYLGVEPEAIDFLQGDTEEIPKGSGTGGSRAIAVGGASLAEAALKVQELAKAKAADMLEAAAQDIAFEDGAFRVVGTDRAVSLRDIAAASPDAVAFDETGSWKPPTGTFPNGCHVVEVEVDPQTGRTDILRYTVVDDFGVVMNPLLVGGQVHGGVAQGIGQALHEATLYDTDTGQLLSGSFMDYTLPRADHLPFLDFKYNVVPCTTNMLGIKGAGEAGAIGAPPAVINAVVNALSPYGIRHIDMPATPLAVWTAIQQAAVKQAAE